MIDVKHVKSNKTKVNKVNKEQKGYGKSKLALRINEKIKQIISPEKTKQLIKRNPDFFEIVRLTKEQHKGE